MQFSVESNKLCGIILNSPLQPAFKLSWLEKNPFENCFRSFLKTETKRIKPKREQGTFKRWIFFTHFVFLSFYVYSLWINYFSFFILFLFFIFWHLVSLTLDFWMEAKIILIFVKAFSLKLIKELEFVIENPVRRKNRGHLRFVPSFFQSIFTR